MDRILLAIDHPGNRSLLSEWLAGRYEIFLASRDEPLSRPFDLCIVDGPVLDRIGARLAERKELEKSVFLPCLAVTAKQDVDLLTRHLWKSVDELVITPISKLELHARVEILLRARRLALELERRNEAMLADAQARLRLAVEAAGIGFWDWDLRERRVYFSPEWKRQIGYADDEISDRFEEWESRLHPDDRAHCAEAVERQLASPARELEVEFRLRHKDGSYRWILSRGKTVFGPAGEPSRMIGVHLDITERKGAEEKIREMNALLEQRVRERTAQLEAANRELEAFSYSVSHDLRAPLRAIDGFSRILIEDYADRLDDEGRRCLERVCASARRMHCLVDDLLRLSRVSRADLRRARVDPGALAETIASELRRAEPERKVEFRIAPVPAAWADPGLMRILMENLLGNAWKFTGKNPTTRIEFAGAREGNETVYFVRDDGAGFDQAFGEKMFDVFQRLHGAGEFEGTGIGLAIVRRIVERHGGRVWAEGAVGKGATIYFSLPESEDARRRGPSRAGGGL